MEAMHSVNPSCLIAHAEPHTTGLCYRFLFCLSCRQMGGIAQTIQPIQTNECQQASLQNYLITKWELLTWGKAPNASGSQQMDCRLTLNVNLLKVDSGDPILHVFFSWSLLNTNHSPKYLADLHLHETLPEVTEKVSYNYFLITLTKSTSQPCLWDWINHELLPVQLQQHILTAKLLKYTRMAWRGFCIMRTKGMDWGSF